MGIFSDGAIWRKIAFEETSVNTPSCQLDSTNVRIATVNDWSAYSATVVIEYTKV